MEIITAKELLSTIFNTADFKKYSRECRNDVVDILEKEDFDTLLDLDCGTGLLLEQILERLPDLKVKGFDYSLDRIAEAKERFKDKDIELEFGQAINLPYEDNSFDVIVSTTTFHHYQQPRKVLDEVYRVLKPNGKLIICDTYLGSMLRYLNKISKPINEVTGMHLYSKKDIWSLLNSSGFSNVKWKLLNKHAYLVMASARPMPLISEI